MTTRALLSHNMKLLRNQRGLSQQALADLVECSTPFIGNIEIGRRFPSPENLDKIASSLGVLPAELFVAATIERREGHS